MATDPYVAVYAVAVFSCAWVATNGAALAQETVDSDELVEQLEVRQQPESIARTRGITITYPDADQGRASLQTIRFKYDSANLTSESTVQLGELGKALADDRLIDAFFVIEGHADAHGDDQYNKELSLRRALTVKNFLVDEMGIAETRLRSVGMGEERPMTDDPYDAANRRVDVVNIKVAQ